MPGYIDKTLKKFLHPRPAKPQHSPHKHTPIQYGQKVQEPIVKNSPRVDIQAMKKFQNIVGTLLYYARVVDPTLAPALSAIAAHQADATVETVKACNQFLDNCATLPNATL